MWGITKALQKSFARKIFNPNLPKTIKKQSETQQLVSQFVPLSTRLTEHQQKIRQSVMKQLAVKQEQHSNKLVNRPAKGAVWGLGGQLVMASKKIELEGLQDHPDEIINFLELLQVKNIYFHDWMANGEQDNNRKRYAIIGSCFSAKHCWKSALQLKNAFNKNILDVNKNKSSYKKSNTITAVMVGSKDEEWSLVQYKDFQIHLMTQQQRQAMDLEWKWNNPPSQEKVEKWVNLNDNRKKRKNQFQDFE